MPRVAPVSFARPIACLTASAAVSEPSVPTTMRLNTRASSFARRTALILAAGVAPGLAARLALGGQAAEAVAEDFFRRRCQPVDGDRHRGEQADDQQDQPVSPERGHPVDPSPDGARG